MKKFLNEFKSFAFKGNVMQLAVAVIIGAAFQSIVSSLTENILSPVIGLITQQNFDSLQLEFLGITLRYGAFITSVINFFILALAVFMMMKMFNALTAKKETPEAKTAAPELKTCPYCQTQISALATRCPACTSELE